MSSSSGTDAKTLCLKYFKLVENDIWKCSCGKILKKKQGTGWTNLMTYIRAQHENQQEAKTSQMTLNFMHCKKSESLWMGWAERLPVTWLNTIWLNFFVESFGLKILSQVTKKISQLHSNSRNKYVNSRKYHNVGHMRCMHARPHRRKDQLPLRSLRDIRSR